MRVPRPGSKDDPRTPAKEPTDAQMARGLVLAILAEAFPKPRAESGVRGELAEVYADVKGWDQHVAYLEEAGYIEVTTEEIGPKWRAAFALKSLKITKAGLDQVDGHVERDPGLYFPWEQ